MGARFNTDFTARDINFSKTLAQVRGQLQQTTMASLALNAAMNAFRVGTMIGIGALAGMIAPAILAAKAVEDYDTSLRRAMALGGKEFAGHMSDLSDRILEVAMQYGVLSEEIAAGVIEFVKAGFSYGDVMDMIEGTAQLALMNQESFEVSANTVTYAWQLWGDEVGDVNEMMEKMHVAATMSVMDIGDLGSAFEYAGSSFNIAGISFNEFLAVFAGLSQVAYTSSQTVGTLINRILVKGDELEEKLKEIGYDFGEILDEGVVNFMNLVKLFESMDKHYEVTAIVAEMWGVRTVAAINAVMQSAGETIDVLAALEGTSHTLEEGADDMAKSIGSIFVQLREAIFAPLKDEELMAGLAAAMSTLKTAISEGGLGTELANLIKVSILFVTDHGPNLIRMGIDFMGVLMDLAPVAQMLATKFMGFLAILTKLQPWMMMAIGTFVLMAKILPIKQIIIISTAIRAFQFQMASAAATAKMSGATVQTSLYQWTSGSYQASGAMAGLSTQTKLAGASATGSSAQFMMMNTTMKASGLHALTLRQRLALLKTGFMATGMAAQLAATMGMFAFITGMMAIATSSDGWVRALGGIAIAVAALAMAMFLLGSATALVTAGVSAVAAGFAMGAFILQQKQMEEDMDARLNEYEGAYGSATGGRVLTTGWRNIHEGEYILPKETFAQVRPENDENIVSNVENKYILPERVHPTRRGEDRRHDFQRDERV